MKHYFVLGIKWDLSNLTFMLQCVSKHFGLMELVAVHSYLRIVCAWKEAIYRREN